MSESFLQDVPATRLTSETIRQMYNLIDQGKVDTKFQELAYSLTKDLRSKDYRGEVNRLFDWVKKSIRYTRDPYGVELLQDVWATITRGRADCDDFTILLGALCEVMGTPIRIITVSTRPDKEPVHVYPEAQVGGRWLPLDVTVASSYPGWAPKRVTDRIVWTRKDVGISGYDEENIEGLGMDFFKSTMVPVDVTPGVPNDISHTYADPLLGTQVRSRRQTPGAPHAPIAPNSELPEAPDSGSGGVYAQRLMVKPFPLPSELWSSVPRKSVPIRVKAWPNEAKPWKKDWSAMLPNTHVPEDKFMSNLNGLGDPGSLDFADLGDQDLSDLQEAMQLDVQQHVAGGSIPKHATELAVSKTVDAVQTGDKSVLDSMPNTKKVVANIKRGTRSTGRPTSSATPAKTPGHAPTAGMSRHEDLRAHANDYGNVDDSTEFIPGMYGLEGGRKSISPQGRSRLYSQVHKMVKDRLPGAARAAGVHPKRIQGLFNPAVRRQLKTQGPTPMYGLSGMGDVDPATSASAASAITNSIMNLVDPADAKAVSSAVDAGVKAVVGSAAPAQSGLSLNLSGWGVPLAVAAAVVGLAVFLGRKKKTKFRMNPSRRRSRSRSRGRSRRGKGAGFEKYIPWALGAGAAYLILKPSAAPAAAGQPAQSGILSSLMNLFKGGQTPAQTGSAIASVASPISSLISSIFGGGSKTPAAPSSSSAMATQGPTAAPSDPFAANRAANEAINQYQSEGSSSSDSGMVTSYDEL